MATDKAPSQQVLDQIKKDLKELGEKFPDLKASTAKTFTKGSYDGTDDLAKKINEAEGVGYRNFIATAIREDKSLAGMNEAEATKGILKKIDAGEKARSMGQLVAGPGKIPLDIGLANAEVLQVLNALLDRYAESQKKNGKSDYEGVLNKVDPAKGSRNDRLAVEIGHMIQAAHKALSNDKNYGQVYRDFMQNDAKFATILTITTKLQNKSATVANIAGETVTNPSATASPATTPDTATPPSRGATPPPLPSSYSNEPKKTPPPLPPMFQKPADGASAKNQVSPPPPPIPPKRPGK